MNNFAAFILSHGRADNVLTYDTLRNCGYSGRIVLIIDDMDEQRERYESKFDEVYVFDKKAIARTTDNGDNFQNLRTTTHARNAIFDAANEMGIDSFVMLDDDYIDFNYRFNSDFEYQFQSLNKNLDVIFELMISFLKKNPQVFSICFSQGGDFIGGKNGGMAKKVQAKRKAMNSFFCITNRRFKFVSRLNEDVNTYMSIGQTGGVFLTISQFCLQQKQTQTNKGGMSAAYMDFGTYVKSFYTVMYRPDCVTVRQMSTSNPRLHHHTNWNFAVPKIVRQ